VFPVCQQTGNRGLHRRPILLRNLVAQQNRKCDIVCHELCNSRATPFWNRAVLCSVQLCFENAVSADWSFLFMRQSCSMRHAHLHTATLSHDEVARQTL